MLPSYDTKEKLVEDYVRYMEDLSLAVEAGGPRERLDDLRARMFALEARAAKLGLTQEERTTRAGAYRERLSKSGERMMQAILTRPNAGDDMTWALGGAKIDALK